jgi:regulator of protease activity HflC (stomatin/prohibitin superfamily)
MKPTDVTTLNDEIGAGEAARDFRASLDYRREADVVMTAAVEARQHAASQADEVVRHSEALAHQIEEEARASARAATSEAQKRAEQVVADALKEAAHISESAAASSRASRREEAEARAAAEAARTRADEELAQARLEIEQLREAARNDVAAQRTMANAALDEQSNRTMGHLETVTREVQTTLDRARGELATSLGTLAEYQRGSAGLSTALTRQETADASGGAKSERRRKPFRGAH